MMEKKKYVGITIGPIFQTIELTSSPVALWAASYLFSTLSATLCKTLVSHGVKEDAIISPYYKADEPLLNQNDGIGLFHDRIIFLSEGFDIKEFTNIKKEALTEISELFGISYDYLSKYVMASAAEFEAENPIMESNDVLNSLELASPFVDKEDENPILSLFSGDSYSKNSKLRTTELITRLQSSQLKKDDGTLKSISDIVATGKGYKKYKYYAIVRADGDNMSKIISGLEYTDIRVFSKKCLEYCSDVAKKVKEYDGVTIFSGGDDLLAILPCESKEGKTVFQFVKDTNAIFHSHFDLKDTSLSFGIMIAYQAYPLYEALSRSADLLFNHAKKGGKNCVALHLQKHSGQSMGLIIPNGELDWFIEFFNAATRNDDQVMLSAMHKITLFSKAFLAASDKETVQNLFDNIFDSNSHKDNDFLHKTLPERFWDMMEQSKVFPLKTEKTSAMNPTDIFVFMMRIMKFFVEKGEE